MQRRTPRLIFSENGPPAIFKTAIPPARPETAACQWSEDKIQRVNMKGRLDRFHNKFYVSPASYVGLFNGIQETEVDNDGESEKLKCPRPAYLLTCEG